MHFILVAVALGSECLSYVQEQHHLLTLAELWARVLVYIAVLLCAILSVPLYRRVRRHPQFDEIQRANRELDYSRRLFKTFLDETPFAAYVVDAKDRFVYVNGHVANNHKVSSDEMIGTTYDKWFPAELTQRLVAQNQAVLSSGQKEEFVNDVVLPVGNATYLSYKFPLPGPDEKSLLGVVSLEISEELSSRAVDSLLAKMVTLSPDAIYTVDEEGKITSWNKAAEEILGYTAAEIIGQSASILAPRKRNFDVASIITRLAQDSVIKDEDFIHVTKEGKHIRLALSATRVKSFLGTGANYAAIGRDQTEVRQTARQMKALNRALDARVAALSRANRELPLARDQAIESLATRSLFAASMSHTIRTPLSGVLGVSELLLDKKLDEDSAEIVKTILDSSEALLTIVNDILDTSKLETGDITIQHRPFNPSLLVYDCVKLVQPGASNQQITIEAKIDHDLPERLFGDPSRIKQVLLNLLGNAIKFTVTGTVTVEAELVSQTVEVATLQFSVTDTGIGIAAKDAPLLFSPFSRIESSTKGIKGSGLGLSISKQLVERMKGKIDFRSRPAGGSRFWFVLPLDKQGVGSLTSASSGKAATSRVDDSTLLSSSSILIVEDSKAISLLTRKQLERYGVKVEAASTGKVALEKLATMHFDLVLMDINLPDMSGYEITGKIREMEQKEDRAPVIIIAVTACDTPGDREKALAVGMNDYLAKPVRQERMRAAIVQWLEFVRLGRARRKP